VFSRTDGEIDTAEALDPTAVDVVENEVLLEVTDLEHGGHVT
jgi:hypothetical protein